jgi:UDP-glucuronate 4-epimerase
MPTPQTILITGVAGFIGSHLADAYLAAGHRVVGLDNFCDFYDETIKRTNLTDAMKHDGFTLVEADIRDRAAVLDAFTTHKPDIVVHLAAMAGVRPSIERPDYYTAVNLDGTVNLLDAAVAMNVGRFAFASSSSVYGNNAKVPFAETDNVDHPISPYAATKKAGELLCHTYWHLHGMPIVALRFFTVFGPRQRPDLAISKFLKLVRDDQEIPMFGDGSTSRDYTYISDIIDGVRKAVDHCSTEMPAPERGDGASGGATTGFRVYNLGGSSPVSLKEMIATIGEAVGRTPRIKQLPMQPGDVNRTYADVTRAQNELGYAPATSLAEGVKQQWDWLAGR